LFLSGACKDTKQLRITNEELGIGCCPHRHCEARHCERSEAIQKKPSFLFSIGCAMKPQWEQGTTKVTFYRNAFTF
jgi:hypothetical protein